MVAYGCHSFWSRIYRRGWFVALAVICAFVSSMFLLSFPAAGARFIGSADSVGAEVTFPAEEASCRSPLLLVFTTGLTFTDGEFLAAQDGWQRAIFRPKAGLGPVYLSAAASLFFNDVSPVVPLAVDSGETAGVGFEWGLGAASADQSGMLTVSPDWVTVSDGPAFHRGLASELHSVVSPRFSGVPRELLLATVPAGNVEQLSTVTVDAYRRGWTVAVVSLADHPGGSTATDLAMPLLFALLRPGELGGLIESPSLRSVGLSSVEDVRAVIVGQCLPVVAASGVETNEELTDLWLHASAARQAQPIWFVVFGGLVSIGLLAAALHFLRRPGRSEPAFIWRNLALWNSTVFATIPAAFAVNAAPWWRLPHAAVIVIGVTVAVAMILAAVAHSWRRFHPLASLSAFTLVLVAVDLLSGFPLLRDSLFGSLTAQFARLYGVGNRVFIVLVVCGLLLLALVDPRSDRRVLRRAFVLGGVLVAVDALPAWGADFGGPPGLIAAFIVAATMLRGVRLRWYHAAAWVGVSVSVLFTAGVVDAFSAHPSHIGRFVRKVFTVLTAHPSSVSSTVASGSAGGADQVVTHKFQAMLATIISVPWLTVVGLALVGCVAVAWWYARRNLRRFPAHRAALADTDLTAVKAVAVGVVAAALCGAAINDSGIIIVADAVAVGGSALSALFTTNLWHSRCS